MSFDERPPDKTKSQEGLRQKFAQLRRRVHKWMTLEEDSRLRENPKPTEEELYMGAFEEWLEPQVREAVKEMYRKGYATQSSGFNGEHFEVQSIDGNFTVDESIKRALERMGVEVLRGADIGLPLNKMVTILRFRATVPSLKKLKAKWDSIAEALPEKGLPESVRPICERAEEFREQYAPEHPSLEATRDAYFEYLQNSAA